MAFVVNGLYRFFFFLYWTVIFNLLNMKCGSIVLGLVLLTLSISMALTESEGFAVD